MAMLFAALLGGTLWWYTSLPTSFLPVEDQGYILSTIQLPDAASQVRTREVVKRMNEILLKEPAVAAVSTIGGFSILDGSASSNAASFFVTLQPWDQRRKTDLQQPAVLARLRKEFTSIQEATAVVFPPPAIRGLGVTGGFQVQIEDRGSAGRTALQQVVQEMVADGSSQSGLVSLNSTFRQGVPQLYANVDRTKVKTLGVPLDGVFDTLQTYLGSAYVNDFNRFGRTYQVRVQADSAFRATPEDIKRLEVRNADGQMVPLSTVVDVKEIVGPQTVTRYNLYPTAAITGEAAPGRSSGQALQIIEQMAAAKLPPSMGYEWTGVSYQEKKVGGEAVLIFVLAVALVYLVLAAQYESWTNPAAVVLVVPLALLGTVMAVAIRGMDNNVYTQIGVVLLVALSSKNAILIVQFARQQRERGVPLVEAAINAARLRFRPILMTSFAFILGVYPLVVAGGAGAASRRALGTAVFGGMLTSTFLAVLFVPVFYVVLQGWSERRAAERAQRAALPGAHTVP
jgi:HAE1 family hydrophobic/amphiphilic exporter-1